MLEGVDKLFTDEQDFKYLLKAKEIFEYAPKLFMNAMIWRILLKVLYWSMPDES